MEKVMNRENQKRAPIYEALEKFRKQRVVPFDVPGLFQKRIMTSFSSFVNFPSLFQIPSFSVIFHHFFRKIPEIRN